LDINHLSLRKSAKRDPRDRNVLIEGRGTTGEREKAGITTDRRKDIMTQATTTREGKSKRSILKEIKKTGHNRTEDSNRTSKGGLERRIKKGGRMIIDSSKIEKEILIEEGMKKNMKGTLLMKGRKEGEEAEGGENSEGGTEEHQ
jgi:hypothetical protein